METIFALSTGALPSAIAIVRISGPLAGSVVAQLAGSLPQPRLAAIRVLRDRAGDILDRALILWMPGPATATGEDLAELHLHGGRAVVSAVLDALTVQDGCRPAVAGEFTRRAFLNGRIDLVEAEGLADLLAAETEAARRQALRAAEGGISAKIGQLRLALLDLAARAEAQLEFGDADAEDIGKDPQLPADLVMLRDRLEALLASPPAERLRDGFRAVIAGPPNAGKSSLINMLADRTVAIESPEAGTTRDLIEVPVLFGGHAVILIDSAGFRDTENAIEQLGVQLAKQAVAEADLLIWLGDAELCPRGDGIKVHSRVDLEDRWDVPKQADAAVSVVTGQGIEELRHHIIDRLNALLPIGDGLSLNRRQRDLIRACAAALQEACEASMPELLSESLRRALRALDRVTGRSDVEQMLDAVFERFCVGK